MFADSEEMGLSVRSSLYPVLSDVRILRFLSSFLSLPITSLLSVTDVSGGARPHLLSLIRHMDAKHGEMVQEVQGKKWESRPGWGGCGELRSGPHPFDRLLSGTARQARRKKDRQAREQRTLHTLP